MRDAAVFAKLIQTGEMKFEVGRDQPAGWMSDPYDPSIFLPLSRNRSEDAVYDAESLIIHCRACGAF